MKHIGHFLYGIVGIILALVVLLAPLYTTVLNKNYYFLLLYLPVLIVPIISFGIDIKEYLK